MSANKGLCNCTLVNDSNSCLQVQICQALLQYCGVMRIPDPAIHTNHIFLTFNENPPQIPLYFWVFKDKQNKCCL